MDNIDFLTKILVNGENEYWVVAKKDYVNQYGSIKRLPDQIIMLCIPHNIQRGLSREEIKLVDLERLKNVSIDCNVFLNTEYSPFQLGQTFYEIYNGFPITCKPKDFLIEALALKSDNIYDYQDLIVKLNSQAENKNEKPETIKN